MIDLIVVPTNIFSFIYAYSTGYLRLSSSLIETVGSSRKI